MGQILMFLKVMLIIAVTFCITMIALITLG